MKTKAKPKISPVFQTGHNCKITAIATVEKYYAQSVGLTPIPLHKSTGFGHSKFPFSIRSIAKKHGSYQGEVLETVRWKEIADDLGYETELVDFNHNIALFRHQIKTQLDSGNLVLACFAVDRESHKPTTDYDLNTSNEHAAVISHYDEATDSITILHWQKEYNVPLKDFYESSMVLPSKRNPEYYVCNKRNHFDFFSKNYDLADEQNDSALKTMWTTKTIVPREDSGFKGKLLVIKKPYVCAFYKSRAGLYGQRYHDNIKHFFTTPSFKKDLIIGFVIGLIAIGAIIATVATLGAAFPVLGVSLGGLAMLGGSLGAAIGICTAFPVGFSLISSFIGQINNKINPTSKTFESRIGFVF